MKKLFVAVCFMFGAVVAVSAQDSTSTKTPADEPSSSYSTQQGDAWSSKEEIAIGDLPSAISTQLQGTSYTGWTASKAWKKEKDGKAWYAVELKKGSEMKKVKFDAQGNVVKEKDKK
jgi:hypothetical protein